MNQLEYKKGKIENVLKTQGFFAGTTVGVSMFPMLRNRRDTIVIRPVTERLKRYDVPLYVVGEKYIMHRIIKVLPNGYIIRGDNCLNKEYVTDDMIIGVLSEFYRNPKMTDHNSIKKKKKLEKSKNSPVNMNGIGYKMYIRICHYSFPIRFLYKRMKYFIKRCVFGMIKR